MISFAVCSPVSERDPDAPLHGDIRAHDRERLGHRAEDPLRDDDGGLGRCDLLDHHGELVAAEPCTRVLGTDARLEPLRDLDEQLVAGRVAEAVVDRLEVVEIDEQDREEVLPAMPPLERMRDAIREEHPVREPRERVVVRLVRRADPRARAAR